MLRNAQGQRGKYLTLELSSTRNPVEDLGAVVSKYQSAKIGDRAYEPFAMGVEIRTLRRHKPRQNIVYLSAELNRLCRIRVSTDISICGLSPVGGLSVPLYCDGVVLRGRGFGGSIGVETVEIFNQTPPLS